MATMVSEAGESGYFLPYAPQMLKIIFSEHSITVLFGFVKHSE